MTHARFALSLALLGLTTGCVPLLDDIVDQLEDLDTGVDAHAFALLVDVTPSVGGEVPGADVDAVSLIKPDGTEYFVQRVVDADIDGGVGEDTGRDSGFEVVNEASDTEALVGEPSNILDGTCTIDYDGFTAMNNGSVLVSFGDGVVIEPGDQIHVWELGTIECGVYDADPVEVYVGSTESLDTAEFTLVGTAGLEETNIVTVE